ncbi:MAG: hypothetical protein C0425_11040 [Chlorobiaceae bacterium]|nr:hypothetical protein [Chlorobiaceae bacterium]MBA4310853.1 hypothetical protein [Chlorobiaceae bacterium]
MRFLEWLKSIGDPGDRLEPSQFIQLQSEDGNENGAIVIHTDETKENVKKNYYISDTDGLFHNGSVSELLFDQIASSSSIINATVQSGRLVQVIASPTISQGLSSGSLSIMKSSNLMTGNVVSTQSKQIAGQLRFNPVSAAKIVTPMIVWQIMNALAGVSHLAKINTKLEQVNRGIEKLALRKQVRTMAELSAAIATLEDISMQFKLSGKFSQDMIIRLSLADRDIQTALAEQRFMVQRFDEMSKQIIVHSKGKKGAYSANQILKEETTEFLLDARILTSAAKASLLSSHAWLSHDLEHNPFNVSKRMKDIKTEMSNAISYVNPLIYINELTEHAKNCVDEMNWFDKNLFSRSLKNEVQERKELAVDANIKKPEDISSSVLIWKSSKDKIETVIVDTKVE